MRFVARIPIALIFALVCLACVHPKTPKVRTPEIRQDLKDVDAGAPIFVSFDRVDVSIADKVFRAVGAAAPKATRWGKLISALEIRIHPTHQALEDAVGYQNIPWLRAWATANVVHLQSPRTWGGGDTEDRLEELLTHELTHSAMYQNAMPAEQSNTAKLKIPTWFLEGMASVTADQGYRRLSAEEIGRYLSVHPEVNVLRPSLALYRDQREIVYSSAHLAFLYLVQSNGEEVVPGLLSEMHAGKTFDEAFWRILEETPEQFEDRLQAILRAAAS